MKPEIIPAALGKGKACLSRLSDNKHNKQFNISKDIKQYRLLPTEMNKAVKILEVSA
jgi:hypothetical protein